MELSKRMSGTKRKAEPTPPWHCVVCNVSSPCEAALHAHLNGKKHKTKESNLREENKVTKKKFWCDLCDVNCNSFDLLRSHCNGKKHKAKESLVKDREIGKGEAEVEMEIEDEEFYCEICDVWCNGKVLMESHFNGKKHKGKEAKKEEFGNDQRAEVNWKKDLWCEICSVECNSKAMMEGHLNGKKHKVKEEKVRIYEETEEEKESKIKEEVRDCEGKDEDGDDQQCKISIEKVVKDTDYNGIEKNGLCLCTDEAVIAKEDKYCGKEITSQEEEKMEEDRNVAEGSNPQGQIRNSEATPEAEENRSDFNVQSKQNMFEEMRELWCLICKVKCDSRAMMNTHLKGMEHKANEALRRGKPISEMEEVKIAMKE